MEWRGSGLKRMSSDEAISAVTVHADACDQICPAKFQEQPMVWTNKKHNLYIESLETSFVQQLHQSLSLSRRNIPDQLHANTHDSSNKFAVAQAGRRKVSKPKSANGRKTVSRPEHLAVSYNSCHLSRSYDALAEVSDQNFTEVTDLTSNAWQKKKTSYSASEDQVVP